MLCFVSSIGLQVEGKGNGIKTVVVNMVEIGKALNRPASCKFSNVTSGRGIILHDIMKWHTGHLILHTPSLSIDPCKYFGCELGAQTQMDPKTGRYIVNGAHESSKLQDMLDGFIKKFVLCPGCDNPETELLVSASKGKISQTCKACGYHGMIDPRHRLTTFIIKNPPTSGEETPGKK